MRIPAWLLILGLAACATIPHVAPAPAPETIHHFDQGWSAADRQVFTTTPLGSHLMPLSWFMGLRRLDIDAPFSGDQLTRYGYLPGPSALPVGFVPDGTSGDPQIGMTCAEA